MDITHLENGEEGKKERVYDDGTLSFFYIFLLVFSFIISCKIYKIIGVKKNTSIELLKLCLSRASSECKIIIEGDYNSQVDSYLFDGSSNGMKRAIEVLKGKEEFGYVHLPNIWRSKIAALVDEL